MKNKKILITGVTGFVGSHMADYLIGLNKSYKIYGIYQKWITSSI